MTSSERDLVTDVRELVRICKSVGIPRKLIESIGRKCLRTPRRQTGRLERRTNRQARWKVTADHPDYSTETDGYLVFLRLLLDMLRMRHAPEVDRDFLNTLSVEYLGSPLPEDTLRDPLTDELLDYGELIEDIVTSPRHGYSRFHIGHQDPTLQPKHTSQNVRWQLKSSNDFQGTMDIRVARLALRIHQLTRNPQRVAAEEVARALAQLCRDLGVPVDTALGIEKE